MPKSDVEPTWQGKKSKIQFDLPTAIHWRIPGKIQLRYRKRYEKISGDLAVDFRTVTRLSGERRGFYRMDTKKIRVHFICVENARRSQMAQGFAEIFGKEKLEVYGACSRPAAQIDPMVIEVMKEKGIDLSSKHLKSLDNLPPVEMDFLVTMGCEETCPRLSQKKSSPGRSPIRKESQLVKSGGSGICRRRK